MALIMVADDEPSIVSLLKDFLQSRGYQVLPVEDGMQVAEKAQLFHPVLIVCDIQMPNVYGTTSYHVLQKEPSTAKIPVIFITGVPEEAARKLVPKDPKVRLLRKPLDLKSLEAAIQELLPKKE
jgi:CheY-like chemotaxis protein